MLGSAGTSASLATALTQIVPVLHRLKLEAIAPVLNQSSMEQAARTMGALQELPAQWRKNVAAAREEIAWTLQTLNVNALELSMLWVAHGFAGRCAHGQCKTTSTWKEAVTAFLGRKLHGATSTASDKQTLDGEMLSFAIRCAPDQHETATSWLGAFAALQKAALYIQHALRSTTRTATLPACMLWGQASGMHYMGSIWLHHAAKALPLK